MTSTRSAFCWGSLVLGLSLLTAVCRADASSPSTSHDTAPPETYSAAALYNLGNTYAREGKSALAVLNYERARLLAPQDSDIRSNLEHVRETASLPAAPKSFLAHFQLLSPDAAYWLGVGGLIIAGICGLLLALKRSPRAVCASALMGGLLFVAYAIGDAAASAQVMREAVVMQTVGASASPIGNTEPLFSVPPAALVQIEDTHGKFSLIRDAQGNVGWVPKSELIRVIDSKGDLHA